MATFWEIAARSVSNLFSLYFVYLQYLFISRFGIKSGICLLIAPVPVHCFSLTFKKCSFLKGETHYLGFVTSEDGIQPDQKKVEAIRTLPAPTCVR